MSDTKLTLIEARQKIGQGWTQEFFARDASGKKIDSTNRHATCWCIIGAIYSAAPHIGGGQTAIKKIKEVNNWEYTSDIIQWNDDPDRTQEQVLELFDRAIATC